MAEKSAPSDAGGDNKRPLEDDDHGIEPQRALIAVHPSDASLAIAAGPEIRVYNRIDQKVHTLLPMDGTSSSGVRAISFSRCGKFFACGGDDKLTRLWTCDTWKCIKTLKSPKKVSVVDFSNDGAYLLFGNKFGDILVTTTTPDEDSLQESPEILLGHYCSILTSLSISHGGTYIATTDRDSKVRVSIMSKEPLQGAHEIQSFCFGHAGFVGCSAFVYNSILQKEFLITGGGDGTVRLWDFMDGRMLSMLSLGASPEQQQQQHLSASKNTINNNEDTDSATPILALQPSQDGRHAVILVDGNAALYTISIDGEKGDLQLIENKRIPTMPFVTDLCLDSTGKYWLVGGPMSGDGGTDTLLACAELSTTGQEEEEEKEKGASLMAIPSVTCAENIFGGNGGVDGDALAVKKLCNCDPEGAVKSAVPRRCIASYLYKRKFVMGEDDRKDRRRRKDGDEKKDGV